MPRRCPGDSCVSLGREKILSPVYDLNDFFASPGTRSGRRKKCSLLEWSAWGFCCDYPPERSSGGCSAPAERCVYHVGAQTGGTTNVARVETSFTGPRASTAERSGGSRGPPQDPRQRRGSCKLPETGSMQPPCGGQGLHQATPRSKDLLVFAPGHGSLRRDYSTVAQPVSPFLVKWAACNLLFW